MKIISPDSESYSCIKAAELSQGTLRGYGFALAESVTVVEREIEFSFPLAGITDLHFLFGVRGVGNHYRLHLSGRKHRFILNRIRDGIQVYLQHAYLKWSEQDVLHIRWNSSSIRVFLNDVCFINVLNDGIMDGRWGFAGTAKPVKLPKVTMDSCPTAKYQWIILGDGYSNNRWNNRDFFSWPELAFGDKGDYLNACVAAGNTRRVLEIMESIVPAFSGSRVIIAAGADDVMEGEPLSEVIERLQRIITRSREMGAAEVHLSTLVPKPEYRQSAETLNRAILEHLRAACDSTPDFHQILSTAATDWLVNGDFPGREAQTHLAEYVLKHFHLGTELAPLVETAPRKQLHGLTARGAARLSAWLDEALGRL